MAVITNVSKKVVARLRGKKGVSLRKLGLNPRALKQNPRALKTNPKALYGGLPKGVLFEDED